MVTNDGTIIKIKHDILCEVAKLVFAGKFEEEKEELPYRMMPGPKAKYRCCVYKEREIVRQRIRLAEGNRRRVRTTTLWYRSCRLPVRTVPSPVMSLPTTARSAWAKPVSSPVTSGQLTSDAPERILTRRNAGNAANVRQPVPTMPLPI